jgi:hypothetical protein
MRNFNSNRVRANFARRRFADYEQACRAPLKVSRFESIFELTVD